MFTSLEPFRLELKPLSESAVPGGGSSGLRAGSLSLFNRLVVAALPSFESAGGAGAGAASPSVGTTGTLFVSSGKGFESAGFCAG